jgi:vesicle transport protein SEC22
VKPKLIFSPREIHVKDNIGANSWSVKYLDPTPLTRSTTMVLSTQISRLSDGLPLAQSVDDSSTETALSEYKQQAKLLLRRITPTSAATCTIDSGPSYSLHYLISPPPNSAGNLNSTSVVFLTIAQRSYPRKLAFAYLDELAKEFVTNYGTQISQRNLRPYAFVGFGEYHCILILQRQCSDL